MADNDYVFGHSDSEVRRLELQSRLLAPGTERILRAAGLAPGQSVLDIGTGAGDVAMLAAGMVGTSGSVLGIDREASVLDRARARARDAGLSHIRYEAGTLDTLSDGEIFDFVTCRYVLAHQADRVGFLRAAAARVGPGGTLATMEMCLQTRAKGGEPWSNPLVPLFEEVRDLVVGLGDRVGVGGPNTGSELVALFHEAGLPQPDLIREVPTMGPKSDAVEWLFLTVSSMLPALEKRGMANAEMLGIDTLQMRLQSAVEATHSQLRISDVTGAWATIG